MGMRLVVPASDWFGPYILRQWVKEDGDWVNAGHPVCILTAGSRQMAVMSYESGLFQISATAPLRVGAVLQRLELLGHVVCPGDSEAGRTVLPSLPPFTPRAKLAELASWHSLGGDERRARLSPRAKALLRQDHLDPSSLQAEPGDARLTARELLSRRRTPRAAAAMGKLTTTARCEVQIGDEPRAVLDQFRRKVLEQLTAWLPQATALQGLALARLRVGHWGFELLVPGAGGPSELEAGAAGTTVPHVDVLLLDLTDLPCDALELSDFNHVELVISMGRVRMRRHGSGHALAEATVTVQFHTATVELGHLTTLLARWSAET